MNFRLDRIGLGLFHFFSLLTCIVAYQELLQVGISLSLMLLLQIVWYASVLWMSDRHFSEPEKIRQYHVMAYHGLMWSMFFQFSMGNHLATFPITVMAVVLCLFHFLKYVAPSIKK